jgi:wobble nucleotide-excising tRNase
MGNTQINPRNVAGALRILVEEFYKIRYPANFTSTMTLGGFIVAVRQAPVGSPLSRFAANLDGLDRFNVYASRFHHSNPNAQNEMLNEHELRNYARGALSLIHDDGASHSLV